MANLLRRQIRERVGTTLTGLSTTGSNVFQSRFYPLESAGLPGLCIYTKDESAEVSVIGSTRTIQKELNLIIEGYVKTSNNLDDSLDEIGKEVEIAMASDININNLATDSFLVSVELNYSGEGEKPFGIVKYQYTVIYRNAENAPDVAV